MNIGTIILGIAILIAAGFAIKRVVGNVSSGCSDCGGSCGGSCSACNASCACKHPADGIANGKNSVK